MQWPSGRQSRLVKACVQTKLVLSIVLVQDALTPFVLNNNQDPVVQSIVSLTISLRHKFVQQISAKVTNTLLFFVEKM